MYELNTERLVLRQWQDKDYSPFALLNANTEVMEFFPSPLNREQSDTLLNKARGLIDEHGWGFWAIEEKASGRLIGMTGLHHVEDDLPVYPDVEIGWRLAKEFWGRGFATEAAMASRDFAFEELKLEKIISFTATSNLRSQAVMKKIGMTDSGKCFEHPSVPVDHPLREHTVFQLPRKHWDTLVQKN